MKTITILIAIIPNLAGQAAVIPAKTATPEAVYIVTRAASAESKALFSARLVKMSATNLRWYDGAGVVRAELPKEVAGCRAGGSRRRSGAVRAGPRKAGEHL